MAAPSAGTYHQHLNAAWRRRQRAAIQQGQQKKGKLEKCLCNTRSISDTHTHKHSGSNRETATGNMLELLFFKEVKSVFTVDRIIFH